MAKLSEINKKDWKSLFKQIGEQKSPLAGERKINPDKSTEDFVQSGCKKLTDEGFSIDG